MSCHCLTTNARQNPLAVDPTRTTGIRGRFVRDILKRFRDLRQDLVEFLVTKDALGLKDRKSLILMASEREFQFQTDAGKLNAFNAWFKEHVEADIFSVPAGTPPGQPWTAQYINSAYRMGQSNAYMASKQAQLLADAGVGDMSQEQFLRSAFQQPETVSKVQLLATRAFENLKGITATMSSQLNQILAQGIADGKGPAAIAKEMTKKIEGLTKSRAVTIARTEVIHAHAEGQLDAFEKLDVKELGINAEWSTAGDKRVCPICQGFEGKVFSMKEARGLIPAHPNCVLGDSLVECLDCLAIMRAKYFGPVVHIFLSDGRKLSVTENHILATEFGWVRAKEIQKGFNLLNASVCDAAIQAPDNQNGYFSIEEIFQFLSESFPENLRIITRSSAKDFHGDGGSLEEKVDIVFADSKLRDQVDFLDLAELHKFSFVSGRVAAFQSQELSGFGALAKLLHRHNSSPYSLLGSSGVSPVFFAGSAGHHQPISRESSSRGNARVNKSCLDRPSAAVESFCDLLNASSFPVKFDNVVNIQVEKSSGRGVFVFDIWSHSLAYSLNGVLSSNCRCSWTPSEPGAKITGGKKRQKPAGPKKRETVERKTSKARPSEIESVLEDPLVDVGLRT